MTRVVLNYSTLEVSKNKHLELKISILGPIYYVSMS